MQQHRLRKSMPLLVKNVVYWIGFEYSNLPHIRIQNQGFLQERTIIWDQFWEQKNSFKQKTTKSCCKYLKIK
jgi:hypothetical protein